MTIRMDLNNATFTLKDVIKIVTFCVLGALAWATLKGSVSGISEDISRIRLTQVENTEKQDKRWEKTEIKWREQEVRLNQIEMNQRLFEQRLQALEQKK